MFIQLIDDKADQVNFRGPYLPITVMVLVCYVFIIIFFTAKEQSSQNLEMIKNFFTR